MRLCLERMYAEYVHIRHILILRGLKTRCDLVSTASLRGEDRVHLADMLYADNLINRVRRLAILLTVLVRAYTTTYVIDSQV
jgi:hypothetical protein